MPVQGGSWTVRGPARRGWGSVIPLDVVGEGAGRITTRRVAGSGVWEATFAGAGTLRGVAVRNEGHMTYSGTPLRFDGRLTVRFGGDDGGRLAVLDATHFGHHVGRSAELSAVGVLAVDGGGAPSTPDFVAIDVQVQDLRTYRYRMFRLDHRLFDPPRRQFERSQPQGKEHGMKHLRQRRERRWYWAPVVAAVASGALAPMSAIAETGSIPCEVAARVGAAPGAVITDRGGLSLEAPPAGAGVGATSYGDDDVYSLVVSRTTEGDLVVSDCGADDEDGADATAEADAASRGACRDDAFKLYGFRWQAPYQWRFNAGTTPGELTKEEAEQALVEGVSAVTDVHTDCGFSDDVSATHAYQGRADGRADFKGAQCRAFGHTDRANVSPEATSGGGPR